MENNYENVRKSYKKLLSSNEEMGLELIGLINAKVRDYEFLFNSKRHHSCRKKKRFMPNLKS